ncbi:hypothetical protein BDZ45DRAFT_79870 [Acephala macrosclerotiorum]|nr:hypothetical protein BDZ45DRAFT_79870 [Acephala macrosclerotiorum]
MPRDLNTVAFLSMQPTRTPVGDTSSTLASQQPAISPVDFPFQASSVRDLSVFPQFGFLPAELRLQIWEQAVFNPKFIEIQYYTDSPNPRIVNHRRYDPLYSVCKESRDVAQALAGSSVVRPMSRVVLHSPRWNARRSHLPIPEPTFVPERDTLFFRPMDHSLENRVITLWSAFRGLHRIEHIAIPLDLKRPIPHSAQWISDMSDRFFLNLKTLTFMLGCEEKSWLGDASIELRDLEQWCMDGRKRTMKFDHGRWWAAMQHYDDKSPFDITELSSRMVAEDEQRYKRVMVGRKPLKVRVVAWKRKV